MDSILSEQLNLHQSSFPDARMQKLFADCTLCPRDCHADRLAGQLGFCGQTAQIRAARAALHMWEEPCISGTRGSGTVFFLGCNLKCVYCQNHSIALDQNMSVAQTTPQSALASPQTGKALSVSELADCFLRLQEQGANNINLVTPSHFVPLLVPAITLAKSRGLILPFVYNTGSYESVSTLRMLDGLIDIYLPDLKYYSSETASRYSHAPDYFEKASLAIAEMFRQVGPPFFYEEDTPLPCPEKGIMKKGVIVRHLILPGQNKDSKKILRYLHTTYGQQIYISIMSQYTPLAHVAAYPELNRRITDTDYRKILDFACHIGIENGFFQEGDVAEESFIPPFDATGL